MVNPFRYPPTPFVFIFCAVIIVKTTAAHAASVERSAVGLRSPIRLIRLDTTLVANNAETNGIRYRNFSPIFPSTNLSAVSTIHSAAACFFEIFRTFSPLVSQKHIPVISAMTIQLTISVSLICNSPRSGTSIGVVKKTFAPEISTSIPVSHLLIFLSLLPPV